MQDEVKLENQTGLSAKNIILGAGATILATLVLMALVSLSGGFVSGTEAAVARTRINLPIIIHLSTVIPAIPLGAYVLWRKKGDWLHKIMGRIWGVLMIVTAISSFWIGRPGSGLGGTGLSFIHIFSIVTLVSIPMGIWAIRKGDVVGHYRAMQGPYIGLLIAGLFAFIPGRLLGNLIFG